MKRFLITITAAMLTIFGANAEEREKTYDFGDIKAIDAGFNYQIYITEGRSDKVKVVYDNDFSDSFKVYYSSNTKTLKLEGENTPSRWYGTRNQKPVKVYFEMDEITSLDLSGAVKVMFEGSFKAKDLEMELSGAASVQGLKINGQYMELDCSGAANAIIEGDFPKGIELDLSGAVNLVYIGNSDILNADISGACSLDCKGNYTTCSIGSSGASKATIAGKGMKAAYECSGACSIDAEDFIVKTAEVELTGACKAKVYASETLYHNVSRASKMTYYGDAELHDRNNHSNIVKGR